ncbi:MAG: nucleotidyl transferase AbiEii/AbiGii toxin family protein [Saprospiraceae bacterium]
MLYNTPNIILPETLALLERLQDDSELKNFFLVGGTALALQIGHRFSIDLDFFSIGEFNSQALQDHLFLRYAIQTDHLSLYTIRGVIKNVKVDFLRHPYPLVQPLLTFGHLRLASIIDIAAMKLNAISHSGQRLKDFIDIFFLLEQMSLNVMLDAYAKKYANSNPIIPLKALVYFGDINHAADPPIMVRKVSFREIERRLSIAVSKPGMVFSE